MPDKTRGEWVVQNMKAELEMMVISNYRRLFNRLIDKHYNTALKSWKEAQDAIWKIDEAAKPPSL
jgi:hypothetical protein